MSEHFDNELDRLLAGRLDGDLSASEAARLDDLLAASEQAKDEAARLERVDRVVRALGIRGALPDVDWSAFHAGVMEQLSRQAERRSRRLVVYRIFSIAASLAAAAAVLLALSLHWARSPGGGPPVAQQPPPEVVQVVYYRPAEPVRPASVAEIQVTYVRSTELERSTAARDAAEQGAPSLAVASGSKVTAPAPAMSLEPFPL
ncbi:MAG: hypothetical protein ACPMAQ_07985 [Phycisphaerae bacterium]